LSFLRYKLTQLHARLDEQIRTELTRRAPDTFRLLRLKWLRLQVKDRLHAMAWQPQAA